MVSTNPRRRGRPIRSAALAGAAAVVLMGAVTAAPVAVAAPPAGTKLTSEDQAAVLAAHNDARQEVGLAPLVWDEELAADAQAWADFLVANHNGDLYHGNGEPLSGGAKGQGENLNGGRQPGQMTVGWLGEKSKFNIAEPAFVFSAGYGHYSAMIWHSTTQVGCGTAEGGMWKRVNVCRYSPPGNYEGESVLG